MKLNELTPDEQAVLMGLLREIVQADGDYSAKEQEEAAELELELGGDAFVAAMAAAKERFTSRERLVAAAKSVIRVNARNLIFGRLVAMAASDGVDESGEGPLKWLTRAWPEVVER